MMPKAALTLTKDDMEFMQANGIQGTKILLHTDQWGVKPSELDRDIQPYKGQANSLIDWKSLDPNEWLDISYWKLTREARDTYEDWKIRLRDSSHRETVGKIIQCLGQCISSRETGSTPITSGSKIIEGDEIVTEKDSAAWIYLVDGSIVRLSSESSFSIFEINIIKKKVFFNMRLNSGHLYFQHRRLGKYKTIDLAQTDLSMFPLLIKEANREHFMRSDHQLLDDQNQMTYVLEENPGYVTQYKHLNKELKSNADRLMEWESEIFLFTPNASFILKNPIFHVFYEALSDTKIYLTDKIEEFEPSELEKRETKAMVSFRGYRNEKASELKLDQWYGIDSEGKTLSKVFDMDNKIKPINHFIKRIPSIHIAREIFLEKNSQFLFNDFDKEKLAINYGYRLWDASKEHRPRLKFLISYVRRSETTNLRSMNKLFAKDLKIHGFDKRYYMRSVTDSIAALKSLRDYNREVVKELTEAEYYLWTLKYGQNFIPTYSR